jgi:CheY-like chemotaxis protein
MHHVESDKAFLRVLLVDDEEIYRVLFGGVLTNLGWECVTAVNGQEAVQLVNEQHFDLIFMDIQMPVMDGFEAFTRIRLFNNEVPIVAFTALEGADVETKVIDYGMTEYLKKPTGIYQISETLNKYSRKIA